MSDLQTRAELIKLSRALGAPEGAVAFLARLGHLELRQLTQAVSQALFNEHKAAFQRLADASRLLPASLVAKISELVFGPMLCARVAALMSPERATEIARKLRTKFLADVTMQLDPRSASELLAGIPTPIIVDVARLLLERHEYVTMGRFVDELTDEAIRAVTRSITDDTALLRIAFFVERRERLVELIEILPRDRLAGIVKSVIAGPEELQTAGLAVIGQLSARQQGALGELAIGLGAAVLTTLIAVAQRHGASAAVAAVIQNVDAAGRRRFVEMLGAIEDSRLKAWGRATTQGGLWPAAIAVFEACDADLQAQAAAALRRLDPPERMAAWRAADKAGQLTAVLRQALA
jgi:hypothetical protein